MITFFRKLRARFISENKFSKYILYATGEIFLVVIGILIALQVNNWNEQRKASKKETVFFENLLIDLQKDEEKLNHYEKFNTKRIEYLDTLLTYIRNPNLVMGIEKFGIYVEPLFYGVDPTNNNTTFESAKSSGVFNDFKNQAIIKDISKYYADFTLMETAFSSILRFIENQFEPMMYTLPESYMNEHTGDLVINEGDVQEFYDKVASIKDYRNITVDYQSLLKKPLMENYIIGDMGRTFNALSKVKARQELLLKLKERISRYD
ncbi:DUF6090 family protein [Winogradskyella sp. A3E31]|uniref:DUF6090 family protein n=1 Tax=Winogradskyella sp. A3E31 TaxID=3349637 RepID=UPI00398A5C49